MTTVMNRFSHAVRLVECGLLMLIGVPAFCSAAETVFTDNVRVTKNFQPSVFFQQGSNSWSWTNTNGVFEAKNNAGDTILGLADGPTELFLGSDGNFYMISNTSSVLSYNLPASGIFPTQQWDLVGNRSYFYVSDFSASTTPFTIENTAPSYSLYVADTGNVGIGTPTPGTRLHVNQISSAGAESLARFSITDDSIGRLDINNASSTTSVFIPRIQGRSGASNAALIAEGLISSDTGANPVIVYNADKASGGGVTTRPLVVYRNANVAKVTVAANGNVTATSFITVSSRSLKDNIVDLDSQKASAALRQLNPVEFVYKDDATAEKRIGFIAEDVPEIVAEPDRKSVPVMDIVALLTRVVKDQDRELAAERAKCDKERERCDKLAQTVENLMKRVADLEQQRSPEPAKAK